MVKKLIEELKKNKEAIDKTYGTVEKGDKFVFVMIGLLLMMAGLFVIFIIQDKTVKIDKIFYSYVCAVFVMESLFLVALYFFCKKKNADRYKFMKKWSLRVTMAAFFIFILPIMIIYFVLAILGSYFRVESVCKNFGVLVIDAVIYVCGFGVCIVRLPQIVTLNFGVYIGFITIIYLLCWLIRKGTEKIFLVGSYQMKYSYRCEAGELRLYFVNMMTIITGVGGLFISKFGDLAVAYSYIIMPLIIFAGYEQLSMLPFKRAEEKNRFIKRIYNEMIMLKEIAIPQIVDYSTIKIKVKLSVEPYAIEAHTKYILQFPEIRIKRNERNKRELIEKSMSEITSFLLDEYAVYEEMEKERFLKEVDTNIENLAKCLCKM